MKWFAAMMACAAIGFQLDLHGASEWMEYVMFFLAGVFYLTGTITTRDGENYEW